MATERSNWYWFKLPRPERDRLRTAVAQTDVVTVLQMLNRYHVAPSPLSLCCDGPLALHHATLYLND